MTQQKFIEQLFEAMKPLQDFMRNYPEFELKIGKKGVVSIDIELLEKIVEQENEKTKK